ncbi:hypothetical protein [Thiomonas sp.]
MTAQKVRKPVVAVDADGVILDFEARWVEVAEQTLGRSLVKQSAEYHFIPRYGITKAEYGQTWDAFDAMGGWATLPLLDGADVALRRLAEHYTIHVVTGIELRFKAARWANIRHHGLPVHEVHVTGHRDNTKETILRNLRPEAFVDDRRLHLEQAHQAGIRRLFWVDRGDEQGARAPGEARGAASDFGIRRIGSLLEMAEQL